MYLLLLWIACGCIVGILTAALLGLTSAWRDRDEAAGRRFVMVVGGVVGAVVAGLPWVTVMGDQGVLWNSAVSASGAVVAILVLLVRDSRMLRSRSSPLPKVYRIL